MELDLVIAGGTVVTPAGTRRTDVGIRAGRIAKLGRIGRVARRTCRRVVDAADCLVLAGAVDPHVHFDLTVGEGMRTVDDFEQGTRSALAGGVTTVIDFTAPQPGQRPLDAFWARRRVADRAVCCDYSLHNVLIAWRPQWKGDLARLVRMGARSVKLFMIYAERGWQADDGMLLEVMEHARRLGVTVCLHAENDALIRVCTRRAQAQRQAGSKRTSGAFGLSEARPPLCEEEAVARAILLAAACGVRLHLVHLSTLGAARRVGQARADGLPVTAETCPQYLTLDRNKLAGPGGHRYGCCPPLRSRSHCRGLLDALREGWLSAIGTDHCAFSSAQKDTWGGDFTRIPYGLPGVETSLRLTWSLGPARGLLPIERWVELHTEGPARLFGLYPRKGSLRAGTDADVVIWDPRASQRLQAARLESPCDWSPFEGRRVEGLARHVFLRGIEVAREGRHLGRGVRGRFLRRQA